MLVMVRVRVTTFTFCIVVWTISASTSAVPGKDIKIAQSASIALDIALQAAQPGDRLIFVKGVYPGNFTALANGTAENPIEIRGPTNGRKVLILGNGKETSLKILGNHWKITGLNISNEGNTGLLVTGDNFLGENLTIVKSRTGVILKGEGNKVINSTIFGQDIGVVADGTRNVEVSGNKILQANTCIHTTTSAQNGILNGNQCNGIVENEGTVLEKNTQRMTRNIEDDIY